MLDGLTLDVNIRLAFLPSKRQLDVPPMPEDDSRDGARQDCKAHAVRQCKVGREGYGLDFCESRLVEGELGSEDLEDVESLQHIPSVYSNE